MIMKIGPSLSILLLVCLFLSINAVADTIIGFEPPAYTAGQTVPSPWIILSPNNDSHTIRQGGLVGTQCLSLYLYESLVLPVSIPATGTTEVSCLIKIPLYEPGAYELGSFVMGSMLIKLGNGNYFGVKFQMMKPFYEELKDTDLDIIYTGTYVVAGQYKNGAVHLVKYTLNWDTNMIRFQIYAKDAVLVDHEISLGNNPGYLSKIYIIGHQLANYDSSAETLFDDLKITQGLIDECNDNGIDDSYDIATGFSQDLNLNGIPDECESSPADFDGDNDVDFADLSDFLYSYPSSECGTCDGCDLDGDGNVNLIDFAIFASEWTGDLSI